MMRNDVIGALARAMLVLSLCGGCAGLPKAGDATAPYRPDARPYVVKPAAATEVPAGRAAEVVVRRKPERAAAAPRQEEPGPAAVTNEDVSATHDAIGRVLRSGDRLMVTIYAPPEPFSAQHVVDERGQINLPYIGTVPVAGKTCSQAQKDIETQYVDEGYYKSKTVTVIIVPPESEYSVSGEVLRPGPYPLTRNQTLLQALARAGRYTDFADPHRVFLIRDNDRKEINLDEIRSGKKTDIVIIPGDVIEVPRRWY